MTVMLVAAIVLTLFVLFGAMAIWTFGLIDEARERMEKEDRGL